MSVDDTITSSKPSPEADLNTSFRLALLGAPNCGKTSLFNALTGGRAKIANYPGVTVELWMLSEEN